eukprot:m.118836 g.118836  ORF g.118836 m.118836 type:complete len:123 (-) comp16134_c4_seq1:442-810(-)
MASNTVRVLLLAVLGLLVCSAAPAAADDCRCYYGGYTYYYNYECDECCDDCKKVVNVNSGCYCSSGSSLAVGIIIAIVLGCLLCVVGVPVAICFFLGYACFAGRRTRTTYVVIPEGGYVTYT